MSCAKFTPKQKRMKRHIKVNYKKRGVPAGTTAEGAAIATVKKFRASKKKSHRVKKAEAIPGGQASGKKLSDFDTKQLALGVKVEMEHTDDKKVAREIAMDHLTEDADYYQKLKTVEAEKSLPPEKKKRAFTKEDIDLKKQSGGKEVARKMSSSKKKLLFVKGEGNKDSQPLVRPIRKPWPRGRQPGDPDPTIKPIRKPGRSGAGPSLTTRRDKLVGQRASLKKPTPKKEPSPGRAPWRSGRRTPRKRSLVADLPRQPGARGKTVEKPVAPSSKKRLLGEASQGHHSPVVAAKSMTPQELEKAIYDTACKSGENWLSQFKGTSLYDEAIALYEKEIDLETKQLERTKERLIRRESSRDDWFWEKEDALRVEKQKLALQLAKQELKATKKSNTGESIMSDVDYDDLFKSEVEGEEEQPLCTCAHCNEPLTKSQLIKGGAEFVASSNDNPHSGGTGPNKTTPARTGGAAKETDNIAPMLKGEDCGDDEEFIVSKADLLAMSQMKTAEEQEQYMIKTTNVRLEALEKGTAAETEVEQEQVSKSETDGPVGTGGMAHDPAGNPLIQWVDTGEDERIAKAIEQGEIGAAGEESIRTEGSGQG